MYDMSVLADPIVIGGGGVLVTCYHLRSHPKQESTSNMTAYPLMIFGAHAIPSPVWCADESVPLANSSVQLGRHTKVH